MYAIRSYYGYLFAISKLEPEMRILDIASGSGYGTAMLLKHGLEVIVEAQQGDRQVFGESLDKDSRNNFV